MIKCCNNLCAREWYHLSCLDPPLRRAPRGDWFCSDDCFQSQGYIYCTCQQRRGPDEDNTMLTCALKKRCRGKEKYHRHCVSAGPVNPGIITQAYLRNNLAKEFMY